MEFNEKKGKEAWVLGAFGLRRDCPEEGYISYKSYIENQLPFLVDEQADDKAALRDANEAIKKQRLDMAAEFTKAGNPGLKLKSELDRIMRNLSLPKAIADLYSSPDLPDAQDPTLQSLKDILGQGKHFLIPSFFRTILSLKKNKREFGIVLHSFEQDLPNVVRELNAFAQGTHPCFSGKHGTPAAKFDNSKGNRFMQLNQQTTAYLLRKSDKQDDTHLVVGSLDRVIIELMIDSKVQSELCRSTE